MIIQRRYIVFAAIAFLVQSCLLPSNDYLFENTTQSIVIEGRVTNSDTSQEVVVSKTVYGENILNNRYVNDAVVRITNETTSTVQELDFIGNGRYVTSGITPQIGATYKLEVEAEGGVYTATETITSAPKISHVFLFYQNNVQYEPGEYLFFVFQKSTDSLQYYKIEVKINDILQNTYADLMVLSNRLFSENQLLMLPYTLQEGDSVNVCIYSISESIYEYFLGLSKQTTNLYSNIQPPQVNPDNNFETDVLGYFQASSVFLLDTVIPKVNAN